MKNKKILYIVGSLVGMLFLAMVIIGSDNSAGLPTEPATAVEDEVAEEKKDQEPVVEEEGDTTDEQESQEEETADSEPEVTGTADVSEYMKVGETYTSNIGMKMTPLEIGRTNELALGFQDSEYYMYVLAEMENGSEEVIDIYQDTVIYIDDYQYESVYISQIEVNGETGTSAHIDLNPGRKCKYIFYTSIPEAAVNASKVEFSVYGLPALFKEDGEWIDGGTGSTIPNETTNSTETMDTVTTSSDGIGNPFIDSNPDKYIPEGITGEIDVIDGTFYSNKPVKGIIPGEYLIVGGGNSIISITDDSKFTLKFINNEVDFENADMTEIINSDDGCSYQVYGNGSGYVVSFYEGGLYLYTDYPDNENDYAEGFYELLN